MSRAILEVKYPRICPSSSNDEISAPRNKMLSQYAGALEHAEFFYSIYLTFTGLTYDPTGLCSSYARIYIFVYALYKRTHFDGLVFSCFCAVLCVCLCTGLFVMVPLNLTCLHCLQYSFFKHLSIYIGFIHFRTFNEKHLDYSFKITMADAAGDIIMK